MREKDLNGKKLAKELSEKLKKETEEFIEEFKFAPRLAMVYVGDDSAAATYIKSKQKKFSKVGMDTEIFHFPEIISLKELRKEIERLNGDDSINGIIIELPLPPHIPFSKAVAAVDPVKDVDGLNPNNIGWLFSGDPYYIPNTPMAVMRILKENNIPLKGKDVVIVGRSLAVGKPLIQLMLAENATVTACHTRTRDLAGHTSRADILVVSAGRPKLVTGDMVREGTVVVDVGINVTEEGLVGDVDYESVYPKASRITPVPGGVGPITVMMIMENTLNAATVQAEARRKNPNVKAMTSQGS